MSDFKDDLLAATVMQNNLLVALIRSHNNKEVLETNFRQAMDRFAVAVSEQQTPLAAATLKAFMIAFEQPLGPDPK